MQYVSHRITFAQHFSSQRSPVAPANVSTAERLLHDCLSQDHPSAPGPRRSALATLLCKGSRGAGSAASPPAVSGRAAQDRASTEHVLRASRSGALCSAQPRGSPQEASFLQVLPTGTTGKGIYSWKYCCSAERQLLLILQAGCSGPTVMGSSTKPKKDRQRSASGSTSSACLGFNQGRSDERAFPFPPSFKACCGLPDPHLVYALPTYGSKQHPFHPFLHWGQRTAALLIVQPCGSCRSKELKLCCQPRNGGGQRGERQWQCPVSCYF